VRPTALPEGERERAEAERIAPDLPRAEAPEVVTVLAPVQVRAARRKVEAPAAPEPAR
jgi:hypothetical protein